jgi:hypothetical protein
MAKTSKKMNIIGKFSEFYKKNLLMASSIVALLIIIIVVGLIKEHSTSSSVRPTGSQILFAKAVIASALQSKGDNISNFRFSAAEKIRGVRENKEATLQVFLNNDSARLTFIIDMNSGKILMRSETQLYENIEDLSNHYRDELKSCPLYMDEGK